MSWIWTSAFWPSPMYTSSSRPWSRMAIGRGCTVRRMFTGALQNLSVEYTPHVSEEVISATVGQRRAGCERSLTYW